MKLYSKGKGRESLSLVRIYPMCCLRTHKKLEGVTYSQSINALAGNLGKKLWIIPLVQHILFNQRFDKNKH